MLHDVAKYLAGLKKQAARTLRHVAVGFSLFFDGVQGVPSSNLGVPTNSDLRPFPWASPAGLGLAHRQIANAG